MLRPEFKLFDYQQQGLEKAIANNGNIALYYDPGVGKTYTALAIYAHYKKMDQCLKLLFVTKHFLAYKTTPDEIKKFSFYSINLFNADKQQDYSADIFSINYEKCIHNKGGHFISELVAKFPVMCVLDEASVLKSSNSKTTKTFHGLANKFKYKILSSGTPAPNNSLEFWPQLHFLMPGCLGENRNDFLIKYCELAKKTPYGDVIVPILPQTLYRTTLKDLLESSFKFRLTTIGDKALKQALIKYAHIIKIAEVKNLPLIREKVVRFSLSTEELKAYNQMKKDMSLIIDEKNLAVLASSTITQLIKLREIGSGFIYNSLGEVITIGSSAIKALAQVLESLGHRQAIIWANFNQEFLDIQSYLNKKNCKYGVINGQYSQNEKQTTLKQFKKGDCQFLLAHYNSLAHGVTLINCNIMIYYSLNYSYELFFQAKNRIYRTGQKKDCYYFYLLCSQTIDEVMFKTIKSKEKIYLNTIQGLNNN